MAKSRVELFWKAGDTPHFIPKGAVVGEGSQKIEERKKNNGRVEGGSWTSNRISGLPSKTTSGVKDPKLKGKKEGRRPKGKELGRGKKRGPKITSRCHSEGFMQETRGGYLRNG